MQANWLGDIGAVHSYLGDYAAARRYYLNSFNIATRFKYRDIQCRMLHCIGQDYLSLNKADSAYFYIKQAIDISRGLGTRSSEIQILNNLGSCYIQQENWQQAFACYHQALELEKKINNRLYSPAILAKLSQTHRALNEYEHAIRYANQSLSLAKKLHQELNVALANLELGHIYFDLDSLKIAENYYRSAIEEIEQIRGEISGQRLKISFFQTQMGAFEGMIRTLVKLQRLYPGQGYDEMAFNIAERAKSRALLDQLYQNNRIFIGEIPLKLLAEKKKHEQKLNAIQTALSSEASRSNADQNILDSLATELKTVQIKFSDIQKLIERRLPRYSNFIAKSQPQTLRQIQNKVLQANQALLEYMIGTEQSHLFLVKKDTIVIFQLPITGAVLRQKIARLHKSLNNADNVFDIPFDLALAHDLHQQLIAPAQHLLLPDETLVIVPDGILFYLPFEILVMRYNDSGRDNRLIYGKYQNADYLVEKHPIVYTSSASLLNPRLHVHDKKSIKGDLLAVGNPAYLSEPERQLALRQNQGWNFQPLAYSEQEVAGIGNFFKNKQIYVNQQAKEEVIKAAAQNYRIVHLSAHGLLDENQPLYSGLALAQDADSTEDGFLQTYEIYDLKLNASLVTLSACGTGLGALKKGEGVVGLTRAFILSGAEAVVVSLWNVADASTAQLMTDFYRNLKNGMDKARALQLAKINLMNKTADFGGTAISYAHPFFWAPFILIGQNEPVFADKGSDKLIWVVVIVIGLIGVIVLRRFGRKIQS